ncbi:hypothetical protein ANCDUO_13096 [Ancylostoma duodenale]|uniref:Uncharacterized protein n=1 Tax=Ancylostoma duodenale TaxID=51022 RepID=A0A0C2D3U9_9BILA|nr:hypothetical protein ANCDUO_13096 [Ancylostoma duodenale]
MGTNEQLAPPQRISGIQMVRENRQLKIDQSMNYVDVHELCPEPPTEVPQEPEGSFLIPPSPPPDPLL